MPLNNPNDPGYGAYATSEGMVSTAFPEQYRGPLGGPAQYRGRSFAAGSDPISRFNREQAAKRRAEEKYEALAKKAEEEGKALDIYDKYTTSGQFVVYKRGMPKTEENIDWTLSQTYYADYQRKIGKYQKTVGEASEIASKYNFQSIDPKVQQSQLASQRYSLGRGKSPKDAFDYSVARQQVYSDKLDLYTRKMEQTPLYPGTGSKAGRYIIGGATRFVGKWGLESGGAASRMAIGPETSYGIKRQFKERKWETAGLGLDVVTFGGGALYRKGAVKGLKKYGVGFFGKTQKLGKLTAIKGRAFAPLKIKKQKLSKLVPIDDAGGLGLRVTGWKNVPKGKGTEVKALSLETGKKTSQAVAMTPGTRSFSVARQMGDDISAGIGATQKMKFSARKGGGTFINKDASQYRKKASPYAFVGQTKEIGDLSISKGAVFVDKIGAVPYISATKKHSKEFIKDAGIAMFGPGNKKSKRNILKEIYKQDTAKSAAKAAATIQTKVSKIKAVSTGSKGVAPSIKGLPTPKVEAKQDFGPQQFKIKQKFKLKTRVAQDLGLKMGIGEKTKTGTKSKVLAKPAFKTAKIPKMDIGFKSALQTKQRPRLLPKQTYKPIGTPFKAPPMAPKIIIPKVAPSIKLETKFSEFKPGKGKSKRKPRYAPSLTGLVLRKKQKKKKGTFTGLEIRGI